MKLQDFDFRIWDSNTNKFIELSISDNIRALPRSSDDLVLELWTGLVDVNGVKLYDGDIFIVFGDEKYKAVCNIMKFYGKPLFERNVELPLSIIKPKEWKLEIIGNIHENAELLKKESISTL